MAKNMYEIFDEFSKASTKQDKVNVLANNWSPTLKLVLQLAYRTDIAWSVPGKYPENYKKPDTAPGISFSTLFLELKRMYLFQKGNPKAEQLTDKRRTELLLILLESLEPREADVIIGILKKDLGVKGLTPKFIKDNIPDIF